MENLIPGADAAWLLTVAALRLNLRRIHTYNPAAESMHRPRAAPFIFETNQMTEKREKRKRWVQRGDLAIEVEVEVVYPAETPTEACLEPTTLRWLDEIAHKAEQGDIDYLQRVGRVFQVIPS
jgi:hypothetical protein